MNHPFFKKLNILKRTLRLSPTRKEDIRAQLSQFIDEHQLEYVRRGDSHRLLIHKESKQLLNIKNLLRPMPIIAAFTILATMLGGGVSYAAQVALPGEAFYPVKIFGENLATDLTFSAKAKAELSAQKVGHRLEEASVLVAQGKMNATTSAILASNFEKNADEADNNIGQLKKSGDVTTAANVALNLTAFLKAHQEVIARFEAGSSTLVATLKELKGDVNERFDEAKKLSDDLNAEVVASSSEPVVKTAVEGRVTAAVNVINEAQKFLDNKKSDMSADGVAEANAKIAVAESDIASANEKIAAGAYADALDLADKAFREAKEVKILAQTQVLLNLRVRREDGREEASSTENVESSSTRSNEGQGEIHSSGKSTDKMMDTATSSKSDAADENGQGESKNLDLNAQGNIHLNAEQDSNKAPEINSDQNGQIKFKFEF